MKSPKRWKRLEKLDMKTKKVIFDTNILISFLITKNHSDIDDLVFNGKIKLVFSIELLDEFITVISRPKFKKYFSKKDTENLLNLFDTYGKLITVKQEVTGCRDPKDNFLLSLAVESKADYLITGDSDLLIMEKIRETDILTWKEFITVI